MKIITIGGLPGAGKTTLGQEMGRKLQCLSLEFELLRDKFFNEDFNKNVFEFTKKKEINPKESLRSYYLRSTIYERVVDKETLKNWLIEIMKYINVEANRIIVELNDIVFNNDIDKLKEFVKRNATIINYVPNEITIDILNTVVCSHALISRLDLVNLADENITLPIDKKICEERFRKREKLDNISFKQEISEYLDAYTECIVLKEDNMKKDVRIENESSNFHLRVAAVIMQDDKYLIQQIDGYDYYILPGGHVHLGEDFTQAIIREVKEEVGCEIKDAKIFCLHENFYPKKDKLEHWVETYFIVKPNEILSKENWDQIENDKGQEKLLHFKWFTQEELKLLDLRPNTIKNLLIDNKITELSYLVDRV